MLNISLSSTLNERRGMLNTMLETVSTRMRDARKSAGLKRTQLAAKVGVSRAAVTQWENGEIKTLRPENLFKVARVLNVSAEWLGTGHGHRQAMTALNDVLHDLGHDDRQTVFDFIQYKIDRADSLIASDKIARYTTMIEDFKADLTRRKRTS